MLNNLNVLFKDSYQKILQLEHIEYTFSASFQEHLKNAFSPYEIVFNEKTTLFTSRESQKQFCPNQWIRLVEYGIKYYDELIKYKQCYIQIRADLENEPPYSSRDNIDSIIKNLRNKKLEDIPTDLNNAIDNYFSTADQALLFKRFITDYTWWHGEKTIERGDFYASALLNLYNVVHVDNGFLIKLTKGLSEYGQAMPAIFNDAFIKLISKEKIVAPIINRKYNIIYFGAPGTGKSKALDIKREQYFKKENYERVTFYPNYSYGQFFGTYKPKKIMHTGVPQLSYEFVPGPFFRLLIKSLLNKKENYLLIIEEINRANAASVFGDVFQLLDRDEDGESEYPIHLSEDALSYLSEYHPTLYIQNGEIKLPNNLYIWTTMNSADQGVQPLDSAFKRRFDFEYLSINANEEIISNYYVPIFGVSNPVNWNVFRRTLNKFLLTNYRHVKEDKLIGPFFIKPTLLKTNDFTKIFENKLLMYLSEDVLKTADKSLLFSVRTYSELVELCSNNNAKIFSKDFYYLLDEAMDTHYSSLSANLNNDGEQLSLINDNVLEDVPLADFDTSHDEN